LTRRAASFSLACDQRGDVDFYGDQNCVGTTLFKRGSTMGFIQGISILAIAIGSGFTAFSSKLEPSLHSLDPAAVAQFMKTDWSSRENHFTASITSGVGMGFLLLGVLGLIVPWITRLGNSHTGGLSDISARTMSTITLWLSVAIILTFGVFSNHWTGGEGLSALLLIVVVLCLAATTATAMIFGWRPWVRKEALTATAPTSGMPS
jgi:hypothetical protein